MKKDFMIALLPFWAEVITAEEIPDEVRFLRFQALQELRSYLMHYQKQGYMPRLLYAIAEKKGKLICTISSKTEMDKLLEPRCPYYDGNRFVPDALCIPEEELICWSETSFLGPLNEVGFKRYMELFQQVLPEEYEQVFGKEVAHVCEV